nr:unnamed protein product [Digitaria exilis]
MVYQAGGWKPALCVVLSEVFSTGTILRSKVAIDWGTFVFSLLFYRSILGAVFTLPFALFFESGKWKDLDKGALGWLFLNAFAGYSSPMSLYYYGLLDTDASYAVIFASLTPLVTFVLSIVLGMEKLRLRSKEGSSKVTGVLICFGGALLISLYKGKVLLLFRAIVKAGHKDSNETAGRHHLRGTLLLLGNCISYACWYPVQVRSIAALGTAAKYWLNLYAVEKRGPVYPPMFSTLSALFIIILGTLLLGESLTVGRLVKHYIPVPRFGNFLQKAKEPEEKTSSGSRDKELQVWPTHGSASEDTISGP